ncbi:MAG: PQQ-binding-like beta-propeller repeat protein [Vicinamibacterales bacterium]
MDSTKVLKIALVGAVALLHVTMSGALNARPGIDWPQFRGIRASGIDDKHPAPQTWSVEKKQGVVWKTPIPGLGHASPVVWGNSVFVATSISGKKDSGVRVGYYGDIKPVTDDTPHEWRVYCLDKQTGAVRWQQTATTGVPKIKRHEKATHANSTLATDGERIIAFFGSEGLYAFDMKGKQLWKKDLGVLDAGFFAVPEAQWETGSSPILHDNVAVIQADVQTGSFLAAFDAKTGRELWRVSRDDVPTWSTPTVHEVHGRTQLIVNGMRHIGAYDFKTGEVIWKLKGLGDIPIPTPVVHDGFVYITNAHGPGAPVFAIRETASGDISLAEGATTSTGVVWSYARGGGYMATPLVYRGLLYVLNYNGVLIVYDAKTGERKFQQRLADGSTAFTASPVAADGKVYMASEDGRIFVLKAGPAYELLSTNDMAESTLATPALSEGMMLWRTQGHVVAIK